MYDTVMGGGNEDRKYMKDKEDKALTSEMITHNAYNQKNQEVATSGCYLDI